MSTDHYIDVINQYALTETLNSMGFIFVVVLLVLLVLHHVMNYYGGDDE